MRWLFLLVLALNLAYLTWGIMNESGDTYADVRSLKNVQSISLLSELKQEGAAELLATEQKLGQKSQAASLPAKVKTTAEVVKNVAVKPEAVQQVEPAAQIESCFTLGPFRHLDKLSGFIREIKSYVVAADFRGREEKEQAIYWVYIQPEASHKKALEVGKRLKAKKVEDFYIINDGDNIHGLSLGRFRNKDGAYGLAEKVKKMGFNVTVEPIFKITTIYWLDYQLIEGVEIPEAIFGEYVQVKGENKVSRLSRQCEE